MGRWKQQDATVCIFGTVNCAFGENTSDARRIVNSHNADCDAYEKRIAELEALVRRVKAKSLRVVVVAGADYCVWCDGSGSWFESEYESGGVCVGHVENTCIHCLGYRKPIRLERWEKEE